MTPFIAVNVPSIAASCQDLKPKLGYRLTTFPHASQIGPLHSTDFPRTSLHKSATFCQSSTLSPSSATTSMLPKKGKAHSLRPWSATPFLPSSLRQSATHLCQLQPRTDSLRRLPYLPTTLLRLTYVLLCVHICLAATVHGVPALIVNGRSLMLTSLLPWTAPRAAEDCCGSHRYTDAHRAFNRLNFRRMMYI